MKGQHTKSHDRCRSKVAIVDQSLANLYHVQTDIARSSATLKDRAAFNMEHWQGKNIFDADRRCRR